MYVSPTQIPSSERESRPGRPRLLCAISRRERGSFLAHHERRLNALPADLHWVEPCEVLAGDMLRWLRPEIVLTCWSTPRLPEAWLAEDDCPLRYVCHLTGSVKRLVPRGFIERGGIVSNWGGLAAEPVAEHALLLALAALRNLGAWSEVIGKNVAGQESSLLGTRSLLGRRVGIHGFGEVARALVRLLRPFRASIRAFSKGVPEAVFHAEGVEPCSSLKELFAGSQVLFECEALTPATEGIVDAGVLAALPDGAVFVNVGRGHLVDEVALLREAAGGRIRLALDVVREEPLSPSSPLLRAPGAVLSPHIGGPTADLYPRFGDFALANIGRFLRGESPEARVTLEIYDRST